MPAVQSESATTAKRKKTRLSARVISCSELDASTVAEMFSLYAANYADTTDAIFHHDLAQKTHVLLLTDPGGGLRGFTTMEIYSSVVAGEALRVLFSGDTIIDPAHWGSPALALEWIRFAGTVSREDSLPLYWLLIVKGHRTYRFLPTFARQYLPHHAKADDPAQRQLLSALAREKFGELFDESSGVVRFPTPQGRLRSELADISERHGKLKSVAHFRALNPGYRSGDELVCLCRLATDNLRPLAARAFTADLEETP